MGGAYPELGEQAEVTDMWLAAEEEGFGRTLAQGMEMLRRADRAARARRGARRCRRADVFTLHDTHGFPYEMTRELLAEEGLSIEGDFDELMEEQRERGRGGAGRARRAAAQRGAGGRRRSTAARRRASPAMRPRCSRRPSSRSARSTAPDERERRGTAALRRACWSSSRSRRSTPPAAARSPTSGTIECEHGDCRARVEDVLFGRRGPRSPRCSSRRARSRSASRCSRASITCARHETECNHTATHLLQAALRERVGSHVRQAGSYVGPDKLRFDFSHGQALSAEELRDVEDRVNEWIARNDPVHAITTTLDEAKRLGAMALFGEKYGEVVRMVEVGEGEYSRELCGGTHVRSTAEIGAFRILHETSSSANVRRIEAVTGPVAVELLREHDRLLREIAAELRTRPEDAPGGARDARRRSASAWRRSSSRAAPRAAGAQAVDVERARRERAARSAARRVLAATVEVADAKALLERRRSAQGPPAGRGDPARQQPPTDACTSSRASPPSSSSAA